MPRLIAFEKSDHWPASLSVRQGDVLMFPASGGRVRNGNEVITALGAYRPSVVGDECQVLAPEGRPSTVLFRALSEGHAVIEVITTIPQGKRSAMQIKIDVEP